MTRFARAEGSKASNKKVPEDGTPWRLLKGKTKHSNDSKAQSSDSAPQNRSGNRVGIVHSDRSNSWSVVDIPDVIDRVETKSKELVKKEVKKCFKCRANGHTYKDCPEKDESEVCFTCGSTEHSFKQCKKRKRNGSNFAFAKCFICKEQGHLSSACPDNPTGLYPYGGGCHQCGEVTHFSKDCPQKLKKSAKKQITVDTLLYDDIEGLPDDKPTPKPQRPIKKAKVVNF